MPTFKLMITGTKIALSDKELELVCNTGWILTKHAVIQKVYILFGEVLQEMQRLTNSCSVNLPAEMFANSPKIAKGENYRLLPYVMLDYPRYFTREDSIAVRTFFWWGNFFSVSLQLSGVCKTNAAPTLLMNYEKLKTGGYSVCVKDDPWEHDFDETNFTPLSQLTAAQFSGILQRKSFVKIAKKMPVEEWNSAPGFIINVFTELVELLKNDHAPRR